eukprot:Rmarinus@m.24762
MSLPYQEEERIGEGTFGVVVRAKNLETGEVVALKKVRLRRSDEGIPTSAIREIKALQHLSHPNIVRLHEVFPQGNGLTLVFECMKTDLFEVLRNLTKPLSEPQVKQYMQMLLSGLCACHAASIMHRDIKPANLLIGLDGRLKLADFGLACVYTEHGGEYSHQVATRWYRAPELLFGARKYDTGVDVWAAGCIFAELLNHAPLFAGENDIDQLYRVLKTMGTPTEQTWPGLNELPDYDKIQFPYFDPQPFDVILPNASSCAIDLIKRMLCYDSSKRVSASEALCHPYFFTEPLACDVLDLPVPVKDKPLRVDLDLDEPVLKPCFPQR